MDYLIDISIDQLIRIIPELLQSSNTQFLVIQKLVHRMTSSLCSASETQIILKLIVAHAMPDPALTDTFLHLLIASCHRQIVIEYMSQIVSVNHDATSFAVLHAYQNVIEEDRHCLVPVLGSLIDFPLSDKLKHQAFSMAILALSTVEESEFPTLVRLMLYTLTKEWAVDGINAIREQTKNLHMNALAPVLDVIANSLKINTLAVSEFLSFINSQKHLLPLDVFILIMLMNSVHLRDRKLAWKSLLHALSRRALDLEQLHWVFQTSADTPWLQSDQSALLVVAEHFLNSGQLALMGWAQQLLIHLFLHFPRLRINILNSIFASAYNKIPLTSSSSEYDPCKKLLGTNVITPTRNQYRLKHRCRISCCTLLSLCLRLGHLVLPFSHLLEDLTCQWIHSLSFELNIQSMVEDREQSLMVIHCLAKCLTLLSIHQPSLLNSLMILIQKQTTSNHPDAQISGLILASHILSSLNSEEDTNLLINLVLRLASRCTMETRMFVFDLLIHNVWIFSSSQREEIYHNWILPLMDKIQVKVEKPCSKSLSKSHLDATSRADTIGSSMGIVGSSHTKTPQIGSSMFMLGQESRYQTSHQSNDPQGWSWPFEWNVDRLIQWHLTCLRENVLYLPSHTELFLLCFCLFEYVRHPANLLTEMCSSPIHQSKEWRRLVPNGINGEMTRDLLDDSSYIQELEENPERLDHLLLHALYGHLICKVLSQTAVMASTSWLLGQQEYNSSQSEPLSDIALLMRRESIQLKQEKETSKKFNLVEQLMRMIPPMCLYATPKGSSVENESHGLDAKIIAIIDHQESLALQYSEIYQRLVQLKHASFPSRKSEFGESYMTKSSQLDLTTSFVLLQQLCRHHSSLGRNRILIGMQALNTFQLEATKYLVLANNNQDQDEWKSSREELKCNPLSSTIYYPSGRCLPLIDDVNSVFHSAQSILCNIALMIHLHSSDQLDMEIVHNMGHEYGRNVFFHILIHSCIGRDLFNLTRVVLDSIFSPPSQPSSMTTTQSLVIDQFCIKNETQRDRILLEYSLKNTFLITLYLLLEHVFNFTVHVCTKNIQELWYLSFQTTEEKLAMNKHGTIILLSKQRQLVQRICDYLYREFETQWIHSRDTYMTMCILAILKHLGMRFQPSGTTTINNMGQHSTSDLVTLTLQRGYQSRSSLLPLNLLDGMSMLIKNSTLLQTKGSAHDLKLRQTQIQIQEKLITAFLLNQHLNKVTFKSITQTRSTYLRQYSPTPPKYFMSYTLNDLIIFFLVGDMLNDTKHECVNFLMAMCDTAHSLITNGSNQENYNHSRWKMLTYASLAPSCLQFIHHIFLEIRYFNFELLDPQESNPFRPIHQLVTILSILVELYVIGLVHIYRKSCCSFGSWMRIASSMCDLIRSILDECITWRSGHAPKGLKMIRKTPLLPGLHVQNLIPLFTESFQLVQKVRTFSMMVKLAIPELMKQLPIIASYDLKGLPQLTKNIERCSDRITAATKNHHIEIPLTQILSTSGLNAKMAKRWMKIINGQRLVQLPKWIVENKVNDPSATSMARETLIQKITAVHPGTIDINGEKQSIGYHEFGTWEDRDHGLVVDYTIDPLVEKSNDLDESIHQRHNSPTLDIYKDFEEDEEDEYQDHPESEEEDEEEGDGEDLAISKGLMEKNGDEFLVLPMPSHYKRKHPIENENSFDDDLPTDRELKKPSLDRPRTSRFATFKFSRH